MPTAPLAVVSVATRRCLPVRPRVFQAKDAEQVRGAAGTDVHGRTVPSGLPSRVSFMEAGASVWVGSTAPVTVMVAARWTVEPSAGEVMTARGAGLTTVTAVTALSTTMPRWVTNRVCSVWAPDSPVVSQVYGTEHAC